jgi:intein/homing endonuclease
MLDSATRDLWLHNAARGSPPPIEEVAELQYNLKSPWFWREEFYPVVNRIRDSGIKTREFFEVCRDGGKCLSGDTIVTLSSGAQIPIRDIREGDAILSVDPATFETCADVVLAHMPSGTKRTKRIGTAVGNFVVATDEHRFLTFDGWKPLSEIAVGDHIAQPRRTRPSASFHVDPADAWLLGLWVAEGHKGAAGFRFTCGSQGVHARAKAIAESRGWTYRPLPKCPITASLTVGRRRIGDTPANLLREFGLYRSHRCDDIRIPRRLFEAQEEARVAFVRGAFSGDGYATKVGARIGYCTISERLARDMQAMLLSIGIESSVQRRDFRGYISWDCGITTWSAKMRFASHVGMDAEDKSLAQAILAMPREPRQGTTGGLWGRIPSSFAKAARRVKPYAKGVGRAVRHSHGSSTMTIEKANRVVAREGCTEYSAMLNGDVAWIQVTSIEDAGEVETFDIETAIHRNFIANGIVSHNSTVAKLIIAYNAEYRIPFMRLRPENKRIPFIGRDQPHVNNVLMDGLHKFICEGAPWLKLDNWQERLDEEALDPYQAQVRSRTWNKDLFTFTNGVSVRGLSINQSPRAEHVPLAIFDDLISEENWMFSSHYMRLLDGAYTPIILPGGAIIGFGTPMSDEDLPDLIRKDGRWGYHQIPGYDEGGAKGYKAKNEADVASGRISPSVFRHPNDWHCLWPERKNWESHEDDRGKTRESMLLYEREILLRRVLLSNALVDIEDLAAALDPTLHYPHCGAPGTTYYGGADPSSLKGDDAAICYLRVDEHGNRIPMAFRMVRARGKAAGSQAELEVVDAISTTCSAFNNSPIMLEANGFQGVIAPLLTQRSPTLPVRRIHLGSQKSTEAGWLAIRTLFRNRRVRLPYGPSPTERSLIESGQLDPSQIEAKRITNEFRDQLRRIALVDGKLETDRNSHDDMVSAFFLAVKCAEHATGSPFASAGNIPMAISVPLDGPQKPIGAEFGNPRGGQFDRLNAAMRMGINRRRT